LTKGDFAQPFVKLRGGAFFNAIDHPTEFLDAIDHLTSP
jgi:hypothetical protein